MAMVKINLSLCLFSVYTAHRRGYAAKVINSVPLAPLQFNKEQKYFQT